MKIIENTVDYFIYDFARCRQEFVHALTRLQQKTSAKKWTLSRYDVPVGHIEELSTDAVYIGDPAAKKLLVFISATHGVEGYCGSAIQRLLLAQLAQHPDLLPADLGLLMIHGLNSWGMQWARRCDQEGIDLNRNCVDFSALPAPDPAYEQVLACLKKNDPQKRQQAMDEQIARFGQKKFDELFSGGQYHCNWAPFYGGVRPAFASQIIEDCIESWRLSEKELVVIDLHSGLGPWGFGELISDHAVDSAGNAFAQKLFGPAVAITALDGSFSVAKKGLQDYRWHQLMKRSGCFLTLEFGSYGTKALFDVLLDEHLFWYQNQPLDLDSAACRQRRAAMIEHFCPANAFWQEAVLLKSWQVFNRVCEFYL